MRATDASVGATTARARGVVAWLIGLELFLAVGAVGGAVNLVFGGDIGTYTDRLPFDSPVLGGVALALLVAVPAAAVAIGALTRRRWADVGHVAAGLVLVGWIVMQVAIIGYISALQPIMFVLGVVIAALGGWNLRRVRAR